MSGNWEAIDVLDLPLAIHSPENITVLVIQNNNGNTEAAQISLLSLVDLVLQQVKGITNEATGLSIINDVTGNAVSNDLQSPVKNDATGNILINDATGNPVQFDPPTPIVNDQTGSPVINDATNAGVNNS